MGNFTPKGIAYITCEWVLSAIQSLVVLSRLYSRLFLTRSAGSDDLTIALASCLLWVCTVIDFETFLNGLGQHETQIPETQLPKEIYWSTISYFIVYTSFFVIRLSVALFVLRLIPSYKTAQRRITYGVILVNFAISAYANIVYGLSCRPLKSNWTEVPDAKCMSPRTLVITSQINAALSCACDIVTALLPQFLLWKVEMSKKTKTQLNFIFYLGLITAALSIGRAATTTEKSMTEDVTWNIMPAYFFSLFELEFGIMFACGPALRQLFAYRRRTRTYLPTNERQYPNQDFERMRFRINLRDVFWYRKAEETHGLESDARAILANGSSANPPPGAAAGTSSHDTSVSSSILDVWEKRIANVFRSGRREPNYRSSSAKPLNDSSSSEEPSQSSKARSGRTFLLDNSTAGGSNLATTASGPLSPILDSELANELGNPSVKHRP